MYRIREQSGQYTIEIIASGQSYPISKPLGFESLPPFIKTAVNLLRILDMKPGLDIPGIGQRVSDDEYDVEEDWFYKYCAENPSPPEGSDLPDLSERSDIDTW
jgi:hypothetical protein